ncbi:MAG: discoidin domain-containing protein, partial [Phycisphaerales bacterium]
MSRKLILTFVVLVGSHAGSATAEMIAYFPFDEGQGTTAVDATGNGNDGTLSGGVAWVPGIRGSAVHLDTAGERIVVNEIDPTAAHNAMTLAAWINWEGNGHSITHQGIFGKRQGWDPRTYVKWFWEAQPDGDLAMRNGDAAVTASGALIPYENEWIHVAMTWDNDAVTQYINAEEINTGTQTFRDTADDTVVSIGCVSATNTETFVGSIDEAQIYDTALTPGELTKAMTGDYKSSSAPVPPDASADVPQDVILSWSPGDYAASHDVYFGTSFADVDAAERGNAMDVLVSQGQTDLTYDPPDLLDFGQTYYWRVDEVNAAPDSSIFKGSVWSFTVEPFVYPIENVTATASHADADAAAANTVNGSGLDADDLHGIAAPDMWLASPGPGEPVWIQYELDDVYKLDEMWVWNYNVQFELVLGFGLKDVTIEYSTDGVDWTVYGDVEFAKGPATPDYAHNTTVDFSGVSAKYIRFNVNSGYGPLGQFGLSEVRFFYKPVQAREPQPASGAEGVALSTMLDWRSGREVVSHELYFGADRAAVADGTALVDTLAESRYEVDGLNLGTTYYWKVDEVNDAAVPTSWEGAIWNFSTQEYSVVEDFESYDDEENRIYDTWLDGWVNDTGSTVGYLEAPFAERSIVHGGSQSMPLQYDNSVAPFYSEAEYDLGAANWSANGADTLIVHVRGNPVAFLERADGSILMGAAGTDIWNASDQFRYAFQPLNGDGAIVARVDSLVDTDPWAKAGVMIRFDSGAGAKNAMAYVTPDGRVGWQYRELPSGDTSSTRSDPGAVTLPHWLRLSREGNVITAAHSSDGVTWEPMVETANPDEPSSLTISMDSTALVGLALTSHSAGNVTSAEFSGVATDGNVTGSWQVEAIGVEQPSNDPAQLYVALEDTNGRVAVVAHPDAGAVGASQWQEWRIPYSAFANVNLGSVRTIYVGVGDRDNPQADGTGLLYVDDILVGHPGSSDPGTSGLMAYYALENDANDSSGNGHDGTVMGELVYVDGPEGYGMALQFDGAGGQYVDRG